MVKLYIIVGFPQYSITKSGHIWSDRTKKWLTLIKNNRGYLQVTLCDNKKHTCLVHRLVLETFVGPCPHRMECRHLNGVKTDSRLKNLQWGTYSENAQDSILHGTHSALNQNGEKNPASKLSDQDRRLIIYQYTTGLFTQKELTKEYKISKAIISCLVTGKAWPFVNAAILSGRSKRV